MGKQLLAEIRTAGTEITAPTLEDIKGWPAVVDVPRACTAYGLSRSYGYELVRRGEFPAKVISAGGRILVVTASIVAALSSEAA